CCSIRLSRSGIAAAAVYTNCSDWRTSIREVAPPFARTSTRRKDSLRESRVLREMLISESSSSNWKYADATLLTRLDKTAFCPHSVANRDARDASVARRNLPQKSSSQKSDKLT